MAIERIPRIRLRGVHDDSLFVVRGDEFDASVLAEDASRFHERFIEWGRFGISAFQATNESEIDVICQTRLVRFASVVVFRRAHLEMVGVEIVPTFRRPHVTLCHEQLDELVTRLRRCEHRVLPNPYNVADDGM